MKFPHLNVRSDYSLKSSTIKVSDIIASAKQAGSDSVAIADAGNLFASIKLYKKAVAEGLKPLIGARLDVVDENDLGPVIVYAMNSQGYVSLMELVSEANNDITHKGASITLDRLLSANENLIVLSGGREGLIGQAITKGFTGRARKLANMLKGAFGDRFYLELHRAGHPQDGKVVVSTCTLAADLQIPVVATNPAVFVSEADFETHEIRSAIAKGSSVVKLRETAPLEYTPEQYLRSPEEMEGLFSDIPSAIENACNIPSRCSLDIELGHNHLPEFEVPNTYTTAGYLNKISHEGLEERISVHGLAGELTHNEYRERLDYELKIIDDMGFPGYFLIVSDFIQWSKDNGIPVGPGRGSGAGSLVAYALKITDLDPLKYDLLFERFLNPERVSMPDFDVDFCMDRREEVISYVSQKYGEDAVSQICTYGTLAAKMVVRDVTRALGYPYAVGNRISKMISPKPGITLDDAIAESSELQELIQSDQGVRAIIGHSQKLEGLHRQLGKHAGGVLIAPNKLTDYTATVTERNAEGRITSRISQLDKDDVESAGLVKFDFLGLKTLTILQNTVKSLKESLGRDIDLTNIPLDDELVYENLRKGETSAVFQVESRGMRDLLRRVRPDCFEDIIALVALYRPGPLESGMVDNFINRKHGREEISFPDPEYQHESLREILSPTYGVILYQEQVMQIAQVLAGYTLGEADMLRRAMGKKKPEEMAKQRDIFQDGAKRNGIDPQLAIKIFDLVEKFAGYGFNKSHSAAYALIAYQTAWLKTHYPSHYMASVLSGDMENTDKIVAYASECERLELKITPPGVNISNRAFKAKDDQTIIFGLGAVKSIGSSAITKILTDREENGPFGSLTDFVTRCRPNKTVIEAAINAGALDCLGETRATFMANYPHIVAATKKSTSKTVSDSQLGMFGDSLSDDSIVDIEREPEWGLQRVLSGERQSMGLYLSGHPLDSYESELSPIITGKLSEVLGTGLEEGDGTGVSWEDKDVEFGGLIVGLDLRANKTGQMAYLQVDDKSRQVDVVVYPKEFHDCQQSLQTDATVFISGRARQDKRTGRVKIFAKSIRSIEMLRAERISSIVIDREDKAWSESDSKKLMSILEKEPDGYAALSFDRGEEKGAVRLGGKKVVVTDDLMVRLKSAFGEGSIRLDYKEINGNHRAVRSQEQALSIEDNEKGQRTFELRKAEIAAAIQDATMSMGG